MLRRFITITLFCFTVPFAVFGQEKFGHDDVKRLGMSATSYIQEKWPHAQETLVKNLPKAAKTAAATFNALDPSAGPGQQTYRQTVNLAAPPFSWRI